MPLIRRRDERVLGARYLSRQGDTGTTWTVAMRDRQRISTFVSGTITSEAVLAGRPGQQVFSNEGSVIKPGDSQWPQDAAYVCSGDTGTAAQYAGRYLGKWPLQSSLAANAGFSQETMVQDSLGTGSIGFGTLGGKSCLIATSGYANLRLSNLVTYRSTGFTLCVGFYTTDATGGQIQAGISNGVSSPDFLQFASSTLLSWRVDGTSRNAATTIGANTWRHYAITYGGTTSALYQDGTLLDSAAITSACRIRTGVNFQVNSGINGYRNIRLYSKALSTAEIAAIAAEDAA